MTTLKEALDQLAKGHELDNEQKKLIIDKWQKELGVQPCKDCISRQAALDIYDDYNVAVENGELEAYRKHRKRLLKLPPVQPKPKVGRWVEYTRVLTPEPINRWEQAWYCSECGYGNQECEDGSAWLEWKYCPNCGAKMVERK